MKNLIKRYNIIYVVGLLMLIMLLYMSRSLQTESVFFYGFAENKGTEVNHIEDVRIAKIHVTDGQEVKQGDLLLEVVDIAIPQKIQELESDQKIMTATNSAKIVELENKKSQLLSAKKVEIANLHGKINELQREIEINRSLYENLQTIPLRDTDRRSPDLEKLEGLRVLLREVEDAMRKETAAVDASIASLRQPATLKNSKLASELAYYQEAKDRLSIYAPSDGLIGSISCEEGENISAFSKMLDFYKHNPTQVKGFVHESMILEVAVGDKLEVASTLHPDIKVTGEVIGLGSRIVEIPERLRKMVDFKTYGREVLIQIPSSNRFLQKEKVMLNASKGARKSLLSAMFSTSESDAANGTPQTTKDQ